MTESVQRRPGTPPPRPVRRIVAARVRERGAFPRHSPEPATPHVLPRPVALMIALGALADARRRLRESGDG